MIITCAAYYELIMGLCMCMTYIGWEMNDNLDDQISSEAFLLIMEYLMPRNAGWTMIVKFTFGLKWNSFVNLILSFEAVHCFLPVLRSVMNTKPGMKLAAYWMEPRALGCNSAELRHQVPVTDTGNKFCQKNYLSQTDLLIDLSHLCQMSACDKWKIYISMGE